MKSRLLIYLVVIILIALVVVLGLRFRHRVVVPESLAAVQTTNNASVISAITANPTGQAISNMSPTATPPTIPINPLATNRPNPADLLRTEIENKNVPIEFYGIVVDQDSNVLAGVEVKAMVVHLMMPDPTVVDFASKSIPVDRITGADGRFEISGVQGASFDLESIQKDGYQAEIPKRGHGPTEGTFDQPVVFKMWSTNIHEQLITGQTKFQIVPDGRPYFIDLTAGTISEAGPGDLKVWIKYASQAVEGQLADWSCQIDAVNGGILEEPLGTAMFMAPANGYVPSFQLEQQIKSGKRGHIGERNFYIMVKNGQEYGQIAVDMYAPYNDEIPGMIRLSYAINPSGARILK